MEHVIQTLAVAFSLLRVRTVVAELEDVDGSKGKERELPPRPLIPLPPPEVTEETTYQQAAYARQVSPASSCSSYCSYLIPCDPSARILRVTFIVFYKVCS